MPAWLKKYWPAIALLIAVVLILDGMISSLATCHPPGSAASGGKNGEEYCSVFQGPLTAFILGFWNIVEAHDKGIVAAFTIILALSTIGLWNATINLYKSGEFQIRTSRQIATIQVRQTREQFKLAKEVADRQAKEIQDQIKVAQDNAAAANKTADAAVATERARFYVVIEHNFLDCVQAAASWSATDYDQRPLGASNLPMAKIKFRNYGKTPGIVVRVSTGIEYSENVPDPVFDEKVVNENIIAAGDFTQDFGTIITGQMTLAQAKKVRDGAANIWVFGEVEYDDVFGERQTHRFLQRLVRVSQFRYVLQSYDYKRYNKST